jgi:hypothetical protein
MAPKRPPMVPPTIAFCFFSISQLFDAGVAVALRGEPVETAVATTFVGSEVDDDDVDVEVGNEARPMEDMVTFGAVELLQQLRRSLGARQQYTP